MVVELGSIHRLRLERTQASRLRRGASLQGASVVTYQPWFASLHLGSTTAQLLDRRFDCLIRRGWRPDARKNRFPSLRSHGRLRRDCTAIQHGYCVPSGRTLCSSNVPTRWGDQLPSDTSVRYPQADFRGIRTAAISELPWRQRVKFDPSSTAFYIQCTLLQHHPQSAGTFRWSVIEPGQIERNIKMWGAIGAQTNSTRYFLSR
ncbi:hypothetical protein C8R43DRAFT_12737 [Mycena crocata]|nr:hypothetical protein C8R43DRAFT_12737 [Mycena crocata]